VNAIQICSVVFAESNIVYFVASQNTSGFLVLQAAIVTDTYYG